MIDLTDDEYDDFLNMWLDAKTNHYKQANFYIAYQKILNTLISKLNIEGKITIIQNNNYSKIQIQSDIKHKELIKNYLQELQTIPMATLSKVVPYSNIITFMIDKNAYLSKNKKTKTYYKIKQIIIDIIEKYKSSIFN